VITAAAVPLLGQQQRRGRRHQCCSQCKPQLNPLLALCRKAGFPVSVTCCLPRAAAVRVGPVGNSPHPADAFTAGTVAGEFVWRRRTEDASLMWVS